MERTGSLSPTVHACCQLLLLVPYKEQVCPVSRVTGWPWWLDRPFYKWSITGFSGPFSKCPWAKKKHWPLTFPELQLPIVGIYVCFAAKSGEIYHADGCVKYGVPGNKYTEFGVMCFFLYLWLCACFYPKDHPEAIQCHISLFSKQHDCHLTSDRHPGSTSLCGRCLVKVWAKVSQHYIQYINALRCVYVWGTSVLCSVSKPTWASGVKRGNETRRWRVWIKETNSLYVSFYTTHLHLFIFLLYSAYLQGKCVMFFSQHNYSSLINTFYLLNSIRWKCKYDKMCCYGA